MSRLDYDLINNAILKPIIVGLICSAWIGFFVGGAI